MLSGADMKEGRRIAHRPSTSVKTDWKTYHRLALASRLMIRGVDSLLRLRVQAAAVRTLTIGLGVTLSSSPG